MKIWATYRNKLIVLCDQAIVSGVSFLFSILLVRLLGINVFGEFAVILLVTQGVIAVNQSLVTSPYQSLYSQTDIKQYSRKLKGIQLVMLFILVIGMMIFEAVLSVFDINIVKLPTVLFSLFFISTVLFDFNRKQLYLQEKYLFCFFKDLISLGSQLLLIAVLVYFNKFNSLEDVLLAIGCCLIIVEGTIFLFSTSPLIPSIALIKSHWHFGKWMLGNSILQWFSGNFYITTGVLLMGAQVAGIIRIGQSLIGILGVFIQLLDNYVPPIAALIYRENGINSLKAYLVDLIIKGGLMIILASTLLVLFRNIIWETIYGIEFLDYTYILFWFGPILLFNFLSFPLRFAIRTINKTQILFEAYLISCFLGFTTAHFFINSVGIHGICLGLLLTQVVMQIWYIIRLFKIKHHENNSYSVR